MDHDKAVAQIVERYFTIAKVPHDERAKQFLKGCQSYSVKVSAGVYKYYRRGSGPTVVLVHGIHSNLGGIVDLAQTLIEAGFSVVLFDVPAHGEAAGTMTDPVEVRNFLRKVCGQLVDVHAVVGHSLGALWGLSAIHDGVRAKAFVAISSPSTCRFLVDKFVQLNGLTADLAGSLVEALERRLGTGFWVEYSPKELVKQVATSGLIIHGEHDDFVPPDHAKELQSSWAGARLEMLPGAGHFDIVGLTKVRKLVAAYLQDIDASRRVDELTQSAE